MTGGGVGGLESLESEEAEEREDFELLLGVAGLSPVQ